MHPVLNETMRALTVYGSVMRSVGAAMNIVNIAQIAMNGANANTAQAMADVKQAERDLADDMAKHDFKKAIEDTDKLNVANAKLKESIQQTTNQGINNWFSFFTAIGVGIGGFVGAIKGIIPHIDAIKGVFRGFGGALEEIFGGAGTLPAFFLSQYLDLVPGFKDANAQFDVILHQFFDKDLPKFLASAGKTLSNFWTITIPNIIISGVNMFGSAITTGINGIAAGFVSFINTIITQANKLLAFIHMPAIPLLSMPTPLQFTPIPLIGGGSSSGDSGKSFTPGGNIINPVTPPNSGGGNTTINNVTVMGSIHSENDAKALFDKWMKGDLKGLGF